MADPPHGDSRRPVCALCGSRDCGCVLGRPPDGESRSPDLRSALVLVEPIFTPDGVTWHSMAFAGGKVVNAITGPHRTTVLEDSLAALDGAGVAIETTEAA